MTQRSRGTVVEVGTWHPCTVATRCFIEHLAGSDLEKVGRGSGLIWAESDIGPKTKFDLHGLLYNFHFGTVVIRAAN